jgi:thiol:disulfide interchange protein DsbD
MLKIVFLLFILMLSVCSFGQDKVEWSIDVDNESSTLLVRAVIAEGWHLYSQHIDNEIGPIPTTIEFVPNNSYKLIGSTREPESLKEYDNNFKGELNFFKDEVVFEQKVKAYKRVIIEGVITYMVCNDTMCLPPTDELFTIMFQN